MFVRLSGPGAQAELVEPADCKRFHVEYGVAGAAPADVAAALGDWADGAADGHVWIRVDAVRRAAAGRVDAGWETEFGGMLAFARSKGWLDDAGDAIAAHVETPT
jgi:hypothetical protein